MAGENLYAQILEHLEDEKRYGTNRVPLSPASQAYLKGGDRGPSAGPSRRPAPGPASASAPGAAPPQAAAPSRPPPQEEPRSMPRARPPSPSVPVAGLDHSPPPELGNLDLAQVQELVRQCRRCQLCTLGRLQTVFADGNPQAELMFIGEGPGADEDAQGLPFVGRAGQLLTDIIKAMGYARQEVYIANIVKCRPPGNRVPEPAEGEACLPYLRRQIQLVQPKVIVLLGATPLKFLLGLSGITKLRGQWRSYDGIPVMPTLHPAYLLRNPPAKRDVWEDMKVVLEKLGRPLPPRGGSQA